MKKEVKNEKFAFCTNKEVKNGKYTFCDHEYWYKDNRLHREDGPAVTLKDGSKGWYLEGTYHREDGPAIEYSNGRQLWYVHGNPYTEDEFNQWLEKKKLNEKLTIELCVRKDEKKTKI